MNRKDPTPVPENAVKPDPPPAQPKSETPSPSAAPAVKRPPFRLYPEEKHWWSFNDYGAVLNVMERLEPKRVLEFGPGSSTLALIEGGAKHIDTCEDNPDWAQVYEERLQGKYPAIVRLNRYTWTYPVNIPRINESEYDLALIDGPLGTDRRGPVVRYCLQRCRAVLAPTEDRNRAYRTTLQQIAGEYNWNIQITETGPLSGGFALFMPKGRGRSWGGKQRAAKANG